MGALYPLSLPSAVEAEQQLLGAVLLDPDALASASAVPGGPLRPEDFDDDAHRAIWRAVQAVAAEGGDVGMVPVFERLQRDGQDAIAGGIAYISELTGALASAKAAPIHARALLDKRLRRRVLRLSEDLRAAAIVDGSTDALTAQIDRVAEALAKDVDSRQALAPVPAAFRAVPVEDLANTTAQAPAWILCGLVPRGHVTVLTGHGGVGKSVWALMFTVSVAAGRPLFGIPTTRCRVLFFSGEDGADLLLQRLLWICAGLGIDPAELTGWLHVLDATEGQPVLFTEMTTEGRRVGVTTQTYADLARYIADHQIDVAVIDNMSDTFDANEIERARVRAYMRSLVQLRQSERMTVLLLAHVDKGTARGERSSSESYSGSTAVHNSARSRIYMAREKDGAIVVEHQKCNLAPLQPPMRLEWPEGGLPRPEVATSGQMQAIAATADMKALLRLVAEFTSRGEHVSPAANSPASAPRLLAGEPGYPKGRKPAEVLAMLRNAERDGLLRKEEFRGRDRHPRERWSLTAAGQALIEGRAGRAGSAGSD